MVPRFNCVMRGENKVSRCRARSDNEMTSGKSQTSSRSEGAAAELARERPSAGIDRRSAGLEGCRAGEREVHSLAAHEKGRARRAILQRAAVLTTRKRRSLVNARAVAECSLTIGEFT